MSNMNRWIVSSIVTFLTGFLSVFVLSIDELTLQSFEDGTLVGLIFVASRAGVKALVELFLAWRASQE